METDEDRRRLIIAALEFINNAEFQATRVGFREEFGEDGWRLWGLLLTQQLIECDSGGGIDITKKGVMLLGR